MKYLKKFSNHNGYDGFINTDKFIRPNVSICKQENEVHYNQTLPHDYSQDYLTFEAIEDTTFTFSQNDLQYSLDNGTTWTTLNVDTESPSITAGNKIMWKQTGLSPKSSNGIYGIGKFSATGNFNAYGNIMSLYYGDNFKDQISLSNKNYAFDNLFKYNIKLINVNHLILPATTLANCCYSQMFYGCTALTTAPSILPATELTNGCYESMFSGCTSLTAAPKLCGIGMATECYGYMFQNCTSLTTAPELHSIALQDRCYWNMFQGCTSLTTAPILPAPILTDFCYARMFQNCTSLNSITMLATKKSSYSTGWLNDWVTNVAPSGTFIKAASMTALPTGANGIPEGWTVQDYVDS